MKSLRVGALAALLSACIAPPSATPVPTAEATAALTAPPAATPTAAVRPTLGPPLSDRYGVIVDMTPPRVRSEVDPRYIATLSGERSDFYGAVSPDGRAFAYWEVLERVGSRVLRIVESATPTQARVVLTLPASEMASTSTGGGVVWSTDGKGLLIGVSSLEYVPGPPDQANVYTALRQVDVATGAVKEIARKAPGFPFFPLAWDRARDVSIAAQWGGGGFVSSYVVVRDGALSAPPGRPRVTFHPLGLRASPDAARLLAWSFFAAESRDLYVWPAEDPSRHMRLEPVSGERVVSAMWRNPREVVVSLATATDATDGDRLEIWPLEGSRRVVMRASHRLDAVRPDGTAAYTSAGVVDLGTGTTARMPEHATGLRVRGSLVLR